MPISPRQRDGRRNSRSTDEEYVVFLQGVSFAILHSQVSLPISIFEKEALIIGPIFGIDPSSMSMAGTEGSCPPNCFAYTAGCSL